MEEPERKIAGNVREYLAQMRESADVYRWVMREFMTKDGWKWSFRLIALTFLGMVFSSIQPYAVGQVFNGVVAQQQELVIASLCSIAALLITQKMFDWAAMHCREWILGLNLGRLDQRATELFFEKSLGQHLSEANTLTASNLENARGRVWTLQSMILFDTIPALAHLV